MALYLVSKIAGTEHAQSVQMILEYDPQPPFNLDDVQKQSIISEKISHRLTEYLKQEMQAEFEHSIFGNYMLEAP